MIEKIDIKNTNNNENNNQYEMINENYNFIEVCAGCGGLSSGLIKAGMTPILLNDNDKNCCQTLKLNHKNIKIKCCSLTELKIEKYKNQIDLLTGGVPCQAFSHAGLRKGFNDERGALMLKFIKMIKLLQPKIFMIENVRGLVTHNNGETIKQIIQKIDKSNLYKIKYKILNSVNFEVPQKRERVIIIGILKKYGIDFHFPKKSDNIITVGEALKNVPKSIGIKYSDKKKELFKLIPQGGCWINLPEEKQKEYLGKSYTSGGGKRGILRRLSLNEPSLTILCSPTQKQTERCHPLKTRPLTIRETARIQTFPDDYEFYGSIASQYKQIGNAVPVNLAYKLGCEIVNCLKHCNDIVLDKI
jgi:DNA (cytosine-5)-methyltransferase 1